MHNKKTNTHSNTQLETNHQKKHVIRPLRKQTTQTQNSVQKASTEHKHFTNLTEIKQTTKNKHITHQHKLSPGETDEGKQAKHDLNHKHAKTRRPQTFNDKRIDPPKHKHTKAKSANGYKTHTERTLSQQKHSNAQNKKQSSSHRKTHFKPKNNNKHVMSP